MWVAKPFQLSPLARYGDAMARSWCFAFVSLLVHLLVSSRFASDS